MNEYTYTFVSAKNSWDFMVLFFATLTVLSLVILVSYLIKSEKSFAEKIRSPFSLLLFTMVVATASVAFYTLKNNFEIDKILISKQNITTPFGTCKFSNIKDATFVSVPVSGNPDSTRFLLIEEYTGKAHPISGESYDIDAILNELKKHLANKID